jgi:SDR family mycofactocin-dependent oxidoreductase
MSDTGRVAGKVALVTGAARGQGRSHAVRLAQEGADVIALDICAPVDAVRIYPPATEADLAETRRLVEALDRRIVATKVDVRDAEGLRGAVGAGVAELGRLDIVCANAAIFDLGPSLEVSEATWREIIDVNLTGVWNTCQAALPHMIEAGNGGSIVITSSSGGLKAPPYTAAYSTAKHGVVGIMQALAGEFAPHLIRVNTIHTSSVDTPMIQNEPLWRMWDPSEPNPTRETAAEVFKTVNALPVPWLDPVDVSNAVLFLCSDEGRYITGVTLPVDAGYMIK